MQKGSECLWLICLGRSSWLNTADLDLGMYSQGMASGVCEDTVGQDWQRGRLPRLAGASADLPGSRSLIRTDGISGTSF